MKSTSRKPMSHYAKILNVSPKTISRDLDYLEQILKKFQGSIDKKQGVGIKLEMDINNRKKLNKYLVDSYYFENDLRDTVEVRCDAILLLLLDNSDIYIKSSDIYESLFIAKTTFHEYMKKIEMNMQNNYNLKISTTQQGVKVLANEKEIRTVITSIIIKYLPNNQYIKQNKKLNNNSSSTSYILSFFNEALTLNNFDNVEMLLSNIYSILELNENPSNKHWIRLSLMIQLYRTKNGFNIDSSIDNTVAMQKLYDTLQNFLNDFLNKNVVHKEILYSYNLFKSEIENKETNDKKLDNKNIKGKKPEYFVSDYLDVLSIIDNSDFKQNKQYHENLIHHVQSFFNQESFENYFSNPILKEVKNKYKNDFKYNSLVCWILSNKYNLRLLNEEEVTSLLIYTKSELINKEEIDVLLLFDGPKSLLNLLLNTIIEKTSNLNITTMNQIDLTDINQFKKYDFVISALSFNLENFLTFNNNLEVLRISPLITNFDLNNIELISKKIISIKNKSRLQITRMIRDLEDIGVDISILSKEKSGKLIQSDLEYNFISQHGFSYLIIKNKTKNKINILLDDNQEILQIDIYMSDWDYMLFSTKLIYVLENSSYEILQQKLSENSEY